MEWLWFSSELQNGEDPEAAANRIFNVNNPNYGDGFLQCTQLLMQHMEEIIDFDMNMKAQHQTLNNPASFGELLIPST